MPAVLKEMCAGWSDHLEKCPSSEERIDYLKKALPELLADRSLFMEILSDIANSRPYPDIREATLFNNEILLYTDPKRLYSVRLYLWEPHTYTGVHDHSAWGVMGPVAGKFEVVKFSREDDGSSETHARLEKKEQVIIGPREIETTLPLNNGIHKTGNPGDITSVTVHLYGSPVRRSYINGFDIATGRIHRMYAPRSRKRMLASEALRGMT